MLFFRDFSSCIVECFPTMALDACLCTDWPIRINAYFSTTYRYLHAVTRKRNFARRIEWMTRISIRYSIAAHILYLERDKDEGSTKESAQKFRPVCKVVNLKLISLQKPLIEYQ